MLQYLILSASSTGNKGIHTMSLENNPQNNIETKINHSGNVPEAMRETPVNDFDNTTLQEAVDQNLIGTPKTPEAIGSWTPSTETIPSTVEKKGFTKKQKLIAGISGAALALGIGAGLKSMGSSDEQIAPIGPVATAPAVPTSGETTPTATETEQPAPAPGEVSPDVKTPEGLAAFIDTFKISGTTFEDVAKSYVDLNSKWLNSGLTFAPDLEAQGLDLKSMIPALQSKYDMGITDNLYTDSKTGNEIVADYQTGARKGTIESWWISWSRGDGEFYKLKIEATSAKLVASDKPTFDEATRFTVDVVTHTTDNGNQNIAQNNIEHGQPGQLDITRIDRMNFVRDSTDAPYKMDSKYLQKVINNSK